MRFLRCTRVCTTHVLFDAPPCVPLILTWPQADIRQACTQYMWNESHIINGEIVQQIWSMNERCGGPMRFATGQANTPICEIKLLPWAWLPLWNLLFCGFLLLACHLMRRVGASHFMCLGSCHQSLGALPPINSNSNAIYLEWWMIDCCRSSNCGQSPLDTCPIFHVLRCGFPKIVSETVSTWSHECCFVFLKTQ